MLVRELMSSPAVTCRPGATVREAARMLAEHDVTTLPVVDARGALIGVVSEADVIRETVRPDQRAHEQPVRFTSTSAGLRVADVMTHFPISVRTDTDVATVAELMGATAVKSLPVVERSVVVGVVSRHDIVGALAREDGRIEAEVDELLRSAGMECLVSVRDGEVTLEGIEDPHRREAAQVLAGTVPGVSGVRLQRSAAPQV